MSAQNPSGTSSSSGGAPQVESLSTPARKRSNPVTQGVAIGIGVVLLLVGLGGGYALGAYLTKVSTSTVDITEAGSTLLEPLMDLWGPNYTSLVDSHVVVSPGPGGSGIGRSEAEAGTIDIGGSDAYALGTGNAPASTVGVVNIPVAISSQLIVYNLSSVSALDGVHLNLNGTIMAEIYDGVITNWDSSIIQDANPTYASDLPNLEIVPVVRSDSSGDTDLFSTYCDMSYSAWTYGNSTSAFSPPATPVKDSESGNGNSGEIGTLLNYSGSVGYVGISYMSTLTSPHVSKYLQYAALGDNNANSLLGGNVDLNASAQANYILWSPTSVSYDANLALSQLNYPVDGLAINLILGGSPAGPITWAKGGGGTNATMQNPTPYPIVNLEYAVVKLVPADPAHQTYVVDFLEWAIAYGNYGATGTASTWINTVGFLPLTPEIQGLDQEALATVTIAA
jgi:phosphate transport system substrate-binding protein